MQTVRHKTYGYGEVISKEVGKTGTAITVRFEDGVEKRFSIPESFIVGALVAERELKDEVDRAIEQKRARDEARRKEALASVAPVASAHPAAHVCRAKKHPVAVAVRSTIEAAYEEYLIKAGYKIETDSGNQSTVPQYVRAVNSVLDIEGMSWSSLKNRIGEIVAKYDVGGAMESFGKKSMSTPINALKRFGEFVSA